MTSRPLLLNEEIVYKSKDDVYYHATCLIDNITNTRLGNCPESVVLVERLSLGIHIGYVNETYIYSNTIVSTHTCEAVAAYFQRQLLGSTSYNDRVENELDGESIIESSQVARFIDTLELMSRSDICRRCMMGQQQSTPGSVFYRSPFQQLLYFIMINVLIDLCGLGASRGIILVYCKALFGLWWTSNERLRRYGIDVLSRRLSTMLVARRSGKSSFLHTLLSMAIVFCPEAQIQSLYVVHNPVAMTEVMDIVDRNISVLIDIANDHQREKYASRQSYRRDPDDYYYMASYKKVKHRYLVTFIKLSSSSSSGDATSRRRGDRTNALLSSMHIHHYTRNSLRGPTYNTLLIDEANFIPSDIYNEVLPHLTIGARLICASSHAPTTMTGSSKRRQRRCTDLGAIRIEDILSCNMTYTCRPHTVAMLRVKSITTTTCICYMFSRPPHLITGGDYQKIAYALTIGGGGDGNEGGGGGEEANENVTSAQRRLTLLNEIGVVTTGLSLAELEKLQIGPTKLASEEGRLRLLRSTTDVTYHISNNRSNASRLPSKSSVTFNDRLIVVYVDPAPTDRSVSKHAMAFVTRGCREYDSYSEHIQRDEYVLLAVEEFTVQELRDRYITDNRITEQNDMSILATILLDTLRTISVLYRYHFKKVLIVPEANSVSMDDFWRALINEYNSERHQSFIEENVRVYGAAFTTSRFRNRHNRKRGMSSAYTIRQRRRIDDDYHMAVDQTTDDNVYIRRYNNIDEENDDPSILDDTSLSIDDSGSVRPREVDPSLVKVERIDDQFDTISTIGPTAIDEVYSIGYCLGAHKTAWFYNFYSTVYNLSRVNKSRISVATHICSTSLPLTVSLAHYIGDQLGKMQFKRRGGAGGKLTITGKDYGGKRGGGGDDLAVAVICATMLYYHKLKGLYFIELPLSSSIE